jgi:hypothetical protein
MLICQNPECGKEFAPNPNLRRKTPQKYCSRACCNRSFYLANITSKKEKNKVYYKSHISKWQIQPLETEREAKLRALAERQQNANGFFKIGDKCEVCGSTEHLLCHEISYSPLIAITLCSSCHGFLHHRFLKDKKVRPHFKLSN